jgi:hypothetical protein
MDPLTIATTFANTKAGASLGEGIGKSLLGGGGAGPSNATSAAYGSGLDGSGWNVNFSGTQSAQQSQDKSSGGLGSAASAVPWYVWAVLAAGVAIKLMNRG